MKPTAVLSWIVIMLIALGIPVMRVVGDRVEAAATQPAASSEPVDMQFVFSGKYVFGISRLAAEDKSKLMASVDAAAQRPLQKVAAAALAAELVGKEDAIERLQPIQTPEAEQLLDWYVSQTPLPEDTLAKLGWYGKLAETYGQADDAPSRAAIIKSARFAAATLIGFSILLIVFGIAGVGLFVTAIVLLALGKLRFRTAAPAGPSHVYVESFALYLSSYLVGSILLSIFVKEPSMVIHILPLVFGVVLGTAWPVMRGVSFATQRADWGIHGGTNPLKEGLLGVLGYLAGLPIVAAMLGVTLLLSWLSGATVSHPISNEVANDPLTMLFIAAIFAPITEELLFRGGFVSHLRGTWGVVMSACISGFIFAAIHPQGWAAIPVLMSIGAVFAVIRQWRDSLIPSIVAHAVNNGCLVTLMILLAR